MEAVTLPQKKKLSKGKFKKTVKNVLCRPDPVFWPVVLDEHKHLVNKALMKYKIPIPEFKKLHWNELKLIPKEKRPKPPKLKKIDGLLFGITECSSAIQSGECSVIILEAEVNPKLIIQPILESCIRTQTPVICLPGLRKISAEYFGIPTSSLGLKKHYLTDLSNEILNIAKCYEKIEDVPMDNTEVNMTDITKNEVNINVSETTNNAISCPYLYRTHKKSRIFIPSNETTGKVNKEFIQQNFIELSKKAEVNKNNTNKYMKMVLKRLSNNPNRIKGK